MGSLTIRLTAKTAYKRLISELVRLGRLNEARALCRRCIDELGGQWSLMALADLDLRRGSTAGLDEFAAWAKRSPSFARYYAISVLYRIHGRSIEALAALDDAVKHSLSASDENLYSPEYFSYESALFAYRNGRHDLALSICDKWEHFVQTRGYGERSYHALRGAANLAAGRQADALQKVTRALQVDRESKTWANNLSELERVIRTGERNFVYDPGECRADYQIFLHEIE